MNDDVASIIRQTLGAGRLRPGGGVKAVAAGCGAAGRAHTRPLSGSTQAHFVGYAESVSFPRSIRQGDAGRCDQIGLG
jgi:hypothetical protein